MTPLQRSRIEKAAADCGFELTTEIQGTDLVLRSAQFPEVVIVKPMSDSTFMLRVDGAESSIESTGVAKDIEVSGYDALYEALAHVAATARTLPNRVAEQFHRAAGSLPRSTEVERLIVQRIGQQLFRDALMDFWRGQCA